MTRMSEKNLKSSIYNKQISKVVTGETRCINWA